MLVLHPSPSSDVNATDRISSRVYGASKERSQCNTKNKTKRNKKTKEQTKIRLDKPNAHANFVCLLANSPAQFFLPSELSYTYEIIHQFNRGQHMRHTLVFVALGINITTSSVMKVIIKIRL